LGEYPELRTKGLEQKILEAAQTTYDIEVAILDQIFIKGDLPNLTKPQILNFMKSRINEALEAMGYSSMFEIDNELLEAMDWFREKSYGLSDADFFHVKPTEYENGQQGYAGDALFNFDNV